MSRIREAQLKDGLPRSAFAYAPASDPATWKLPYRKADGSPDPSHLPGAAAAMSAGGFRGQKVDVPANAVTGIKRKLRKAYNEWKGADAEMPDSIKEGAVTLERVAEGPVANCPSCGEVLIIKEGTPSYADDSAVGDVMDATSILAWLRNLKAGEIDEPDQVANIDTAIAAIVAFVGQEIAEVPDEPVSCPDCGHADDCSCDMCDCSSMAHDVNDTSGASTDVGDMGYESGTKPGAEEVVIESESTEEAVTFTESGMGGEFSTLQESGAIFNDEKREIIITPIRPGFGNPKDNYFYPVNTLKEATEEGIFLNSGRPVKMYANHPRRDDERSLPERSVWDWVSSIKEVWWDESAQKPQARIKVYNEQFWSMANQAPDEIAFSIVGGGQSRRGRVGNREARIVESLKVIKSVDWVTEAGAGGAIERFAESAQEEFEMDLTTLTPEQLKEAAPELYAAILTAATPETPEVPVEEPVAEAAEVPVEEPVVEPVPATETETVEAPVAEAADLSELKVQLAQTQASLKEASDFIASLKKERDEAELRDAIAKNKSETAKVVESTVAASTLPKVAKDKVIERFAEATVGEGYLYESEDTLKTAISRDLNDFEKVIADATGKRKLVQNLGAAPKDESKDASIKESVLGRMAERWGVDVPITDAPINTAGSAAPEDDGNADYSEAEDGGAIPASAAVSGLASKFGVEPKQV